MSCLQSYLEKTSTTQAKFALRIGKTQGFVSKLARGEVVPTLETAFQIERETDGAVKADSWLAASGISCSEIAGGAQ